LALTVRARRAAPPIAASPNSKDSRTGREESSASTTNGDAPEPGPMSRVPCFRSGSTAACSGLPSQPAHRSRSLLPGRQGLPCLHQPEMRPRQAQSPGARQPPAGTGRLRASQAARSLGFA
jgi:hypothetical protein